MICCVDGPCLIKNCEYIIMSWLFSDENSTLRGIKAGKSSQDLSKSFFDLPV